MSQPEERPRPGFFRRLIRFVLTLIVLVVVIVATLPLWASTGPGRGILLSVASFASGEKVAAEGLSLGYGGTAVVEGFSFGDDLTLEQADVHFEVMQLLSGVLHLRGTLRGLRYEQVITEAAANEAEAPKRESSQGASGLPRAQIALEIFDARIEIRDERVTPASVTLVEGLNVPTLELSCDGSVDTLQASVVAEWEKILAGGYVVRPSRIELVATPEAIELRPSSLEIEEGKLDLQGKLTLTEGAEHLALSLAADNIRPREGNAQPIRGVNVSASLGGLSFLRGLLEGQEMPSPLDIVRGLEGEVKLRAQHFEHRFAEPIAGIGDVLDVSGLDGAVNFASGRIETRNLTAKVLGGDVAIVAASTAPDAPLQLAVRAARAGQAQGRLPVRNLELLATVPTTWDSAGVSLTCDEIAIEEQKLQTVDCAFDWKQVEPTLHRVDLSRAKLSAQGGSVSASGSLVADTQSSLADYKGEAALSGYQLTVDGAPVEGLVLQLDLKGIPLGSDPALIRGLTGTASGTFQSLPTDLVDLTAGTLGVDFADGYAIVRELSASAGGGNLNTSARVFLGTDPGELQFKLDADGVTLKGADSPLRNLTMAGDLQGFGLAGGLHQPDLGGTVKGTFDSLPLSAVYLDKGSFDAKAASGRVDIEVFDFAAGPGKMVGDGYCDLAQNPPEWEFELANDRIGVRKGYGALLGFVVPILAVPAGNLNGELNSDVKLSGRGFSFDELKQHLTGSGTLRLKEGQLSGSPILKALVPVLDKLDVVGIEDIVATFDIADGKVQSNELDLTLRYDQQPIYLGMSGWVDFDTNMSYGIKLKTLSSFVPDDIKPIMELLGENATVPLHLRGTLAEPTVGPPSKEELAKLVSEGALGKLTQDPEGVIKQLGGLLGGDQNEEPGTEGEKEKSPAGGLLDKLFGGEKEK